MFCYLLYVTADTQELPDDGNQQEELANSPAPHKMTRMEVRMRTLMTKVLSKYQFAVVRRTQVEA